jgi:superfamily II DNA/RNA helicase
MYNNNKRNSFSRFKRPSFNRSRNLNRRSFSKHIDPFLYTKKAQEFIKIEDTPTVNTFSDFDLNPILEKNIKSKGYLKPTLIQDQVIRPILEGKDVLGIAATGTGKTAAFAIPLINNILKDNQKRILILAPTRELAMQIKEDIRSFTWNLDIYLAIAIGGSYIKEQIRNIRRGPHIIVGTPGRIKDLADRRVINFAGIDTLILDEVDRMLDMGFIKDIQSIVKKIPYSRQTLFFSATTDNKIEVLINTFLKNPIKVNIKTQDASSHVEQNIVKVPRQLKEQKLHELLIKDEFKKVLVFGSTKKMVDKLTMSLGARGFRVDSIHGDKPQNKRQRVVRAFKNDDINIMIATDVAARGLDIADITHVINYDEPNNYQDYIHRIGRTGRGNSKGYALTFVD